MVGSMILHLELEALVAVVCEPQMAGFDTSKHVGDCLGVKQKESHSIVRKTNRKGTVEARWILVEVAHQG